MLPVCAVCALREPCDELLSNRGIKRTRHREVASLVLHPVCVGFANQRELTPPWHLSCTADAVLAASSRTILRARSPVSDESCLTRFASSSVSALRFISASGLNVRFTHTGASLRCQERAGDAARERSACELSEDARRTSKLECLHEASKQLMLLLAIIFGVSSQMLSQP
jgi:hypothetical protein